MSILIKGMKMPKKAMVAFIFQPDDEHDYCYIRVVAGKGKGGDYEIIPLPEKHGDLVDISQEVNIEYFDAMNQEWSWKAGTVADALVVCEEFPMTIVEAEGD